MILLETLISYWKMGFKLVPLDELSKSPIIALVGFLIILISRLLHHQIAQQDYAKAAGHLTFAVEHKLQEQVEELTEKTKDNDYMIKAKLRKRRRTSYAFRSSYEAYGRSTGIKEAKSIIISLLSPLEVLWT